MLKNSKGFTLFELLAVIIMISCFAGVVFQAVAMVTGNFYFTERGILKELKVSHPTVSEILSTKRNIYSNSQIMVLENGEKKTYCLDSSILFNYFFSECKQ